MARKKSSDLKQEAKKEAINQRRKDVACKEFWRQNQNIADLINGVFYDGKQVYRAEDFTELDTDVSVSVKIGRTVQNMLQNRDVIKRAKNGNRFAIFGIESQSTVDKTMLARVMMYDACTLYNEMKKAKRGEAVFPIKTIVMYYGERKWRGAKSIYELLDIREEEKRLFSNYEITVIDIKEIDKYNIPKGGVKLSHNIIKDVYDNKIPEISSKYEDCILDEYASNLIASVLSDIFVEDMIEKNKNMEVDKMCNALKRYQQEGVEQGIMQGLAEGLMRGEARGLERGEREGIRKGKAEARATLLAKLLEKLSIEEASEMVDMSVEEIESLVGAECVKVLR